MIKIKGKIATFTGKDLQMVKTHSAAMGLSPQDWFTGCLWELIMRKAREGLFTNAKKKGVETGRIPVRGSKKDLSMESGISRVQKSR